MLIILEVSSITPIQKGPRKLIHKRELSILTKYDAGNSNSVAVADVQRFLKMNSKKTTLYSSQRWCSRFDREKKTGKRRQGTKPRPPVTSFFRRTQLKKMSNKADDFKLRTKMLSRIHQSEKRIMPPILDHGYGIRALSSISSWIGSTINQRRNVLENME